MTRKYTLSEIGAHIEEIKGSNSLGYDRKRILWFIASTFEEVY